MMNARQSLILFCFFYLFINACKKEAPENRPVFIDEDITRFWEAYDQIQTTTDSLEQLAYLNDLFLSKASEGQQLMIDARRYTAAEYLVAIRDYPNFWNSIRSNTMKAAKYRDEIAAGVQQLQELYPLQKQGAVYFTMGVFRSPGTTVDSMVLIGSEFAFGNTTTDTKEFPTHMQYVADYHNNNPIQDMTFLNVHEFVHTQQSTAFGVPLIYQCLREGIAEFVTVKALKQPSPNTAIGYGEANDIRVKKAFERNMFDEDYSFWLWSSISNEFDMRDLGYYVGYAIAEQHYENSTDKNKAIAEMIGIDYYDAEAVEAFIDETKFFSNSLADLSGKYEARIPKVIGINGVENQEKEVGVHQNTITFQFSHKMDVSYRSTDFGPLGPAHCPKIKNIEFAADSQSVQYTFEPFEKGKQYQFMLGSSYRTANHIRFKPYLMEFWTLK